MFKGKHHRERFKAIYLAEFPIGTRHGTRTVRSEPYFAEGRWLVDMLCDCNAIGPVPVADLRGDKAKTCHACAIKMREPTKELDEEITESVLAKYRRAELAELDARHVVTLERRAAPGAIVCKFCQGTNVHHFNGICQCGTCQRSWDAPRKGRR